MQMEYPKKPAITKVGSYTLGKTLGKGAFGKVKHGTHVVTGEEVAIKIVKAKNAIVIDEIEKEISVLKLLNHPHIVKLKDVIRDVNTQKIYMVLELITGGELFDRIVNEGQIPENDARKLFRQMISAVEYCHGNLIVHRDLKPENMLMDANGNVKINDFGFSNFIKPGEFLKTSCGSPIYAAPEVVMQQMYVGTAVDIWSLGVVLFACVAGHLPWSVDKFGHIKNLQELLDGKFTIPANLSREIKDLLKRMIEPNGQRRATLQEVRVHPWVNIGYSAPPPCYLEHRRVPIERINEEVLKQLIPLKFDINAARQSILSNEQCLATSIYHLFLEQLTQSFTADDRPTTPTADELKARRASTTAVSRPSSASPSRPTTARLPALSETPPIVPTSASNGSVPSIDPGIAQMLAVTKKDVSSESATARRPVSLPAKISPLVLPSNSPPSRPTTPGHKDSPASTPHKTSSPVKMISSFFGKKKDSARGSSSTPTSPVLSSKSKRNSGNQQEVVSAIEFGSSGTDEASMRVVKGLYNVCAVSNKNAQEIAVVLQEVLVELDIHYTKENYLFRCKHKLKQAAVSSFLPSLGTTEVTFDAEICKVKDTPSIGIRVKRLAGDVWAYKSIYRELTTKLKV